MLADMPGCWRDGHACGLRASAPHAKPFVPPLTRRKRKALITGLFRCAVEDISLGWGRSHQGHKYRRRCCGNRELTHCRSPSVLLNPIWVSLILHKNDILMKIKINKKINIHLSLIKSLSE
jgi:hypothetical protein